MTTPAEKIMTLEQAKAWEHQLHQDGLKLVVTNGVFDLLHRGHVQYLQDARNCGDRLLVAINSDEAVHKLKGPTRPIVHENDRAFMLAALECISAVVIFDATKPVEVFKALSLDVYAKGGDYTEETLDREEYAILKAQNPKFVFITFVDGFSTTNTIKAIKGTQQQTAAPQNSNLDPRLQFIFSRRSVRAFQPRPIGDELVEKLLDAAMAAPSACAKDPWHAVVLKDDKIRKAVADCLPNGRFLADAPCGIVMCGDIQRAHGGELSYLLQDVSSATENLLLAANALSLGACWLGIHPRQDRIDAISQILQLPDNVIPIAGIALGFPAQEFPPRTRKRNDCIHWNDFLIRTPAPE